MLEMVETRAVIPTMPSNCSLVILDEIGLGHRNLRRLAPLGGVRRSSHLHEANRCRTLFATITITHALSAKLPRLIQAPAVRGK